MNYILLDVGINKLHVNITILQVDIIHLACRRQKYATIELVTTEHKGPFLKKIVD